MKFETVEDLAANAIEDSNECIADFVKVNTPSTLLNKAKDFEFITSYVKPAVELSRKSAKVTKKPYYYTLQLIFKKNGCFVHENDKMVYDLGANKL